MDIPQPLEMNNIAEENKRLKQQLASKQSAAAPGSADYKSAFR